jgi:hypothetical protein
MCPARDARLTFGSLFNSVPDHVPARAYCGWSSGWDLLEDPLPRLAQLLVCSQTLLVYLVP